ncbi:hypothetical protein BC938DRAFT_481718 [Jimgerdemannia flammicorona]|uniref:Uncharacterized protein n=1 Tax=Jimgerdemannia flammicorona TaxID=994334 RepID=A0A433QFN5_9FUNG|nr:hypothetical protein BC938DRAFT_481718 [Jimgerdemannia flammicorona]
MQSKALTHRSLPIHIDNHLILPAFALFVTSSTLLYYYFSTEATRRAFEAARRRHLLQREKLASSEAKYASLRIHGQFANPFVEWRDTPWWETVLFWLGRIRGNSVPSNEEAILRTPPRTHQDLTSALPITKPSFDLLFPPAVSALDGPSRLPPSIRVFGTATPSLSESWVDAATVTASAPTSGIGIPPRIVFDPAPAPEQGPRMTYTWLGQSTSFVTMDGFNILTDPVFRSVGVCRMEEGVMSRLCVHLESPKNTYTLLPRRRFIYIHLTNDHSRSPLPHVARASSTRGSAPSACALCPASLRTSSGSTLCSSRTTTATTLVCMCDFRDPFGHLRMVWRDVVGMKNWVVMC